MIHNLRESALVKALDRRHDAGVYLLGMLLLLAGLTRSAAAEPLLALSPAAKDRCPVCGMFVAKYPDWIAQIRFADEVTVFFDGAKDFFKYYFRMDSYHPGRSKGDAAALYVTDYYSMQAIDATTASFVLGSDVYGPMGHELIPFANPEDAEAFRRDHHGRQIVPFSAVTPELMKRLD